MPKKKHRFSDCYRYRLIVCNLQNNDPITGLDRVDDPRGANVGVGDRVVRQPETAASDGQLELGLGRVRQRGEAGEPP